MGWHTKEDRAFAQDNYEKNLSTIYKEGGKNADDFLLALLQDDKIKEAYKKYNRTLPLAHSGTLESYRRLPPEYKNEQVEKKFTEKVAANNKTRDAAGQNKRQLLFDRIDKSPYSQKVKNAMYAAIEYNLSNSEVSMRNDKLPDPKEELGRKLYEALGSYTHPVWHEKPDKEQRNKIRYLLTQATAHFEIGETEKASEAINNAVRVSKGEIAAGKSSPNAETKPDPELIMLKAAFEEYLKPVRTVGILPPNYSSPLASVPNMANKSPSL